MYVISHHIFDGDIAHFTVVDVNIREFGNQQRQRQKLKITSVCVCELKHIIQLEL